LGDGGTSHIHGQRLVARIAPLRRFVLSLALVLVAMVIAVAPTRAADICSVYGPSAVHEPYWGGNLSFVAQDTCTVPNLSASACQAKGGDPFEDRRQGAVCFLPAPDDKTAGAAKAPVQQSSPTPRSAPRPDLPNSVRLLLAKYKQTCAQAYAAKDWDVYQQLLNDCQFLWNSDGGAAVVERQAQGLCLELFNRCSRIDATTGIIPTSNPTFAKYKQLSDFMNCPAYGGGCQDRGNRAREFVGDLNLLVNALNEIEQRGGGPIVPPALKSAIVALRNAAREANNIDLAVQRVNHYLALYRQDLANGCTDPEDPPPNACTARIDRRWLAENVDYALNWQNQRSVIRDETNQIIDRWAEQRAHR
jgi:hypothetical protein